MKHFNLRLGKADKGLAAIEFALLAPLLILTVFGLIEIANYVFCFNKMNRTAQGISNIVTRGDLTRPQLDALLQSANHIAEPFNFVSFGCVIVSSVSKTSPNANVPPDLMWTDSYPSAGCGTSRVNLSALPGGLVLNTNETIITTEVFYNYQPIIPGYSFSGSPLIPTTRLMVYALAVGVPRQGLMTTLPPN